MNEDVALFLGIAFIFYVLCGIITSAVKFFDISDMANKIYVLMVTHIKTDDPAYDLVTSTQFRFWCGVLLRLQAFLIWPSAIFRDYRDESRRLNVKVDEEGRIFIEIQQDEAPHDL